MLSAVIYKHNQWKVLLFYIRNASSFHSNIKDHGLMFTKITKPVSDCFIRFSLYEFFFDNIKLTFWLFLFLLFTVKVESPFNKVYEINQKLIHQVTAEKVVIIFTQGVRPSVPTFKNLTKQNHDFQVRIVIATGGTAVNY